MNHNAHVPTPAEPGRDRPANEIAAIAGQAGERLKELGGEQLQRAGQALTQAESAVRRRAQELGLVAGDYVAARPWRALGVAAAVGLVAGLLLARR